METIHNEANLRITNGIRFAALRRLGVTYNVSWLGMRGPKRRSPEKDA
jgi:hypothetical protein